MAIIKEYRHGGAVIRVHNDAYQHLSAHELEERKREIMDKAGKLCWEQIEENQKRGNTGKQGFPAINI